jgi:protein tyrosine/serine phosphatase
MKTIRFHGTFLAQNERGATGVTIAQSQTPSFLGRCSVRSFIRTLFTCALAMAIASLPATGRAAERSSAVAASISSSSDATISIDNFGRVSATYFRGAQPIGRDYASLAALGIKTVIDLQRDGDESERQFVESAGMKFYRIPMTTHEPPTTETLARFLQLVNDPANLPVYVHCAGGRHRTGVMTAAYRMTHDGWTADQAFNEMKQYKFGADFLHPEFKRFVYGYHADPGRTAPIPPVVATHVPN